MKLLLRRTLLLWKVPQLLPKRRTERRTLRTVLVRRPTVPRNGQQKQKVIRQKK